jgi:Tfp pilus assembly protein PilF
LLLEALKKAELAKQNASGQQGDGAVAPADPASGLSLEPTPGDAGERPLITRDRLPDITQPLEILSEDLPSARTRRERRLRPPVRAAPMAAASAPAAASEDDDRASARQLFDAKTPDYDPRRPFFIVVGLLGIVIVGTLGYFAWESSAPAALHGSSPRRTTPPTGNGGRRSPQPAGTQAPTTSAAAPVPSDPVTTAITPAASHRGRRQRSSGGAAPCLAHPGAVGGGSRSPARPAPSATGQAAAGESAEPRLAPAAPRSPVRVTAGSPRVDPVIERAWEALQAGDLPRARAEYQRALGANPRDRDALLGLATIDARTQRFESAEAGYLRVLELEPRDPYAQAGLIALRGQTDPLQSESRIKNMLAQQPDAAFLNFPLGNQYAAQGRWPDAQAAYFRAFSADPDNADYAYNLAVSLDHLGQGKLALEYYRRALALAGNRAVGFNSAQVEARIRELTR